MTIADGTVRIFLNKPWVWSTDSSCWYEQPVKQRHMVPGSESELYHFNNSRKVTLSPWVSRITVQKTADQLTIEALQAKLVDSHKLNEKLHEDRNALYERDPGMGGMYRRVDREDMAKSDLLESPGSFSFDDHDDMQIVWSRNARMKFRISGQCSTVQARWFHCLPYNVQADNWWHVCAQVGLTEPLARLFYFHPENGQESAVAKAKPVQRGPIIYCQGDYID